MARRAPNPAVIAIRSVRTEEEVNAKIKIMRDTKSFKKENSPIDILTRPEHKLMTIINKEISSKLVNLFVNPRTTRASKMIIAEYIYKTPKIILMAVSKIEPLETMANTRVAV